MPVVLGELHAAARPPRGPGRRCRPGRRARRRSRSGSSRRSSRPGRLGPGELDDPARPRVSATTRIALAGGPVEQAQPLAPAGGPGRPTPRPWRRGREPPPAAAPRATPAAAWSTASTCRCPARRRAGRASPARARRRGRGRTRRCRSGRRGQRRPSARSRERPSARCRRVGRRRAGGRARPAPALADERLDEACSRRRRCGTGPPSAGRPRRRPGRRSGSAGRATRSARGAQRRLRRGSSPRPAWMSRPGLRRPCRRRSSCRARTCRAGGARRGRPRSCSGSRGAAAGRRRRRRSRA